MLNVSVVLQTSNLLVSSILLSCPDFGIGMDTLEVMFAPRVASRLIFAFLITFLPCCCCAHLAKREQSTLQPVVQISDGQVQNPPPPCTTCSTTLIRTDGGAIETLVLPAYKPPTASTTIPVTVNGQPRVAVVGPADISFLPPNDILVGSTVVTADPTRFIVGTQEVANGRPPVTIDGETLSFGSQGLFVDGIPKTFVGKPTNPTLQKPTVTNPLATNPANPSATGPGRTKQTISTDRQARGTASARGTVGAQGTFEHGTGAATSTTAQADTQGIPKS